jgi:hypothetical protein
MRFAWRRIRRPVEPRKIANNLMSSLRMLPKGGLTKDFGLLDILEPGCIRHRVARSPH